MSCETVKRPVIYVSKTPFAVPKIWATAWPILLCYVSITGLLLGDLEVCSRENAQVACSERN